MGHFLLYLFKNRMSNKMSVNFGNEVYWEERYKKAPAERFDWLHSYEELKHIITSYIPSKQSSILYVGCGTSELADKLCNAGYNNVTCVDVSKEAIKQQRERGKKRQQQGKQTPKFKIMDASKMEFQNQEFDVVIDKCLLDAVLCADDSLRKVLRTLRQISRVLKQNGVYLMFSYQSPDKRIYYLKNRLTKFQKVQYFPINRFQSIKNQNNKQINQNADDTKSMISRVSKSGTQRRKRNHYCYVCTRVSESILIKRRRSNIKQSQNEDQQQLRQGDQDQDQEKVENEQQNEQQQVQNQNKDGDQGQNQQQLQGQNNQKENDQNQEGGQKQNQDGDGFQKQKQQNEEQEQEQKQKQKQEQEENQNNQEQEQQAQQNYQQEFENQQQQS